jgi:uncharacterized protein YjbI with pentapeptide repeats
MSEDCMAEDTVAWETCTDDDCIGVRLPTGGRCWAHADGHNVAAALKQFGKDGQLDARGVSLSAELLQRLLAVSRRNHQGRPAAVIAARFDRATFRSNASFYGMAFYPAAFAGATFQGDAVFGEATFQGDARFDRATFQGEAKFSEARFECHAQFDKETFRRRVAFHKTVFQRGGQFDRATFQGDAFFDRATFMNAKFRGATFRDGAEFLRAVFQAYAWFDEATFQGRTMFYGAAFKGGVTFVKSTFQSKAVFDEATFQKRAQFDEATFRARAGFPRVSFHHDAKFDGAAFQSDADFAEATFQHSAWFSGTVFERHGEFSGVAFQGRANFHESTFQGDAVFGGAAFQSDAVFDRSTFQRGADFAEATFQRNALFSPATFQRARQLGPLLVRKALQLDKAVFHERAQIEVAAAAVCCQGTRFPAGVQLRVRWAQVVLDDADLAAPSILTGASPFKGLDERHWARALQQVQVTGVHAGQPRLMSVRRADVTGLTVAGVDMRACRFAGTHHLDRLRIEECNIAHNPRGWRWTTRQTIAEEHHWRAINPHAADGSGHDTDELSPASTANRTGRHRGWYRPAHQAPAWLKAELPTPAQIAALYRALRKGREDSKDEPGAADFYYGEMEMRRHDRTMPKAERLVLFLYWLFSGYALRASRALAWLLGVLAVASVLLATVGLEQPAAGWPFPARLGTAALVALEGAVFRASEQQLSYLGRLIQAVLRFAGPILLGLAVLSIRGRVKR